MFKKSLEFVHSPNRPTHHVVVVFAPSLLPVHKLGVVHKLRTDAGAHAVYAFFLPQNGVGRENPRALEMRPNVQSRREKFPLVKIRVHVRNASEMDGELGRGGLNEFGKFGFVHREGGHV